MRAVANSDLGHTPTLSRVSGRQDDLPRRAVQIHLHHSERARRRSGHDLPLARRVELGAVARTDQKAG
jgi:hypothetical protein